MTDGYLQFNSQVWPLPSNLVNPAPIIQLANPVMYQICSFFQQILNTNLMPRWAQECAACGMTHNFLDAFIDGYPVAQTVSFPVEDLLAEANEFKFPLLSIHALGTSSQQWTLTNTAVRTEYKLCWVLPPMTDLQYNRLYDFMHYAEEVLVGYGAQGYDPKVNTNSVWEACNVSFGSFYGTERVFYEGVIRGRATASSRFPVLEFFFSFQERNQQPVRQNYQNGFVSPVGIQLNLVDPENPANPLDNFIDGYVYPNITVVSCSPSSGTINGNTMLLIQGTGFSTEVIQSANQILICGAPAKAVTVKSPTAMLVITSPGINGTAGQIGDVVILDQNGNAYTLPDAYTYV